MSSESFLILNQTLNNGLRPETNVGSNVPYLEYMKNLRPFEPFGAVQPDPITNDVALVMDYPFPQYVKENKTELILDYNKIYDSAEAQITTYNSESQGSTLSITGTKIWHWAVMKEDVYFLTNAGSFAYKLPSNTSNRLCVYNKAIINSLCEDKNILYMGGVSDANGQSWFTGSRWLDLMAKWKFIRPEYMLADEDLVWGTHWLFFANPVATDTPHYLTLCALGMFGTTVFDKMKEQIYTAIEDGQMGFVPMRHTGEILVVKMLGARLVAYGVDGVSVFGQSEDGSMREWPVKKDIGISARGVVGGTKDKHIFIDSNKNLWHFMENTTAPEYDGFSEFMPDMENAADVPAFAGYIDHADWVSSGEPNVFCAITQTNTIMAIDSGYIKEFDVDGTLTRRVAITYSGTPGCITSDGTYVAFSHNAGVTLLNYSDLSLISYTNNFPTSDNSKKVFIIAGGFLFTGHNHTVYKHSLPGLALSTSVNHSSLGGVDIVDGVYDGTNLVWTVGYNYDRAFKTNTSCVLVGSYVAMQYPRTQSIGYSSGLGYYIVQSDIIGTGENKWAYYDTNLAYVSDVDVPVYYEACSRVVALGSRLYLADRYDPQTHIIMMDVNQTSERVVINYDCLRKEFWISSSAGSYIYTESGKLGGLIEWATTALFRDDANALSGYAYDRAVGDREVQIRTVPLSTGERGHKQTDCCMMECANLNHKNVRMARRTDFTSAYSNSTWTPFNKEDAAFPRVSFVDGKIEIKGIIDDDTQARIQRVEMRYSATDRRFRRGTKSEITSL
jgi:hypothetical protein